MLGLYVLSFFTSFIFWIASFSRSVVRQICFIILSCSFKQECRRMNKELQTVRRQNSNLDSDRHEKDKTLNHLRTRVAVLEQELKDKEMVRLQNMMFLFGT